MKRLRTESQRWRIVTMRILLLSLIMNFIQPPVANSLEAQTLMKPAALSPWLSSSLKKVKAPILGKINTKSNSAISAAALTSAPNKVAAATFATTTAILPLKSKATSDTKAAPIKPVHQKAPAKIKVLAPAQIKASAPAQIKVSTPSQIKASTPSQIKVSAPSKTKVSLTSGVASSAFALETAKPVKKSATVNIASANAIAAPAKKMAPAELTAECVAVEKQQIKPVIFNEPQRIKTPPAQIIQYAKDFWDEADNQITKRKINISGTKTFEMKQAEISGDIGHFSTENYDSLPGFKLDQSLHLEIDGNITETSTVHAVLDDKEDEDRRFTVNINGPVWQFVMGDFPLALEGSEFALFRKEVRGILAQGSFSERFKSIFLFSQSKGQARREQFRGAGQQQEFRMQASPIVQSSERVSIDGRQISRGTDYFIDYEDGLIKFLPQMLPIELTSWIVVEYEVADTSMAFSRNLFGTRQVYTQSEGRSVGLTWLREVDSTTPKSGTNASDTVAPMQHDIVAADADWSLTPSVSMKAETAVSMLDPNRNSNLAAIDKSIVGHASKFGLLGKTARTDGEISFRRIDSKFKVVGREGGVLELGERGLVNDILSGRARLNYKFNEAFTGFADGEKSETNLDKDPTLSAINFKDVNTGMVWSSGLDTRVEVRGGRQFDRENGPIVHSDITRNTSAVVYDRKIGKLNTQSKINKTGYDDSYNLASDSSVLEMNFKMGAKADETFSWNTGISRIAVEDDLVKDSLRSETRNYDLDLNYEPNRVFNARGLFQWRREDDFLSNSRADTEIADSQLRYEPTRDLRTQLKYKIENTSKIIRDPELDQKKYLLPPSLPNSAQKEAEILSRFENPVQKTTANFITDYRLNRYLQAYFDWRRRDLQDQKSNLKVSSNDRRTYELRYTPFEKMMLTTEYEEGFNRNHEPQSELRDSLKSVQLRHEFSTGYILDATYEEKDENDIFVNANDIFTKSKIMGLQRSFSQWAALELGLQYNTISALEPSREWEKRLAVILTPVSRSQRYRFFANHKDISARQSSTHYEGGLNFSQFIGTDTIIDGEVKRVHSSAGLVGQGYDATVVNAKMVITF